MSKEGIELLIKQAESLDKGEAEQVQQADPDYMSADEIKQKCRERAAWMIGKYHIAATIIKPEAAAMVLTDPELNKGVDRLAAVLEKYPMDGELPPWVKKLLGYEEVFSCGVWFAGSMYGLHQADKLIQAEKEKQKEETEKGSEQ